MTFTQGPLAMVRNRVVAAVAVLVPAVGLLLYRLQDPSTAHLVGHFGIDWGLAFAIVTMVAEGSWMLLVLFPWMAPVEATVEVVLLVAGAGAAAGW